MKIFVDTCVIMDFLQSERKEHEASLKALVLGSQNHHELFVSAKSITDIYYLMRKVLNNEKKTIELITNLLEFIDVLDTTKEAVLGATKLGLRDFEDAIAVETALESEMDIILTSNTKDFNQKLVEVYSPKEVLKKL